MPASDSIRENDSSVNDRPAAGPAAPRTRPRGLRRLIAALTFLLIVLLMAFIPPLLNISRFQRRIASNISASIGRPVHFDRVALALLPLPGVTLENFVVEEDPAFGYEPILRAGEVRATLRIAPLWRRRVEFSSISLSAGDVGTAPTVNLVHIADGRWNIQALLLQASRIRAAPTAQKYAGPAPRFPYIEATGARLNLKFDRNGIQEKTPFSLTDADFALWLPEPHQWHLRLEAHPARTDTAPADTGTIRIEGTLGSSGASAAPLAGSLAQLPIDLTGQWQDAQLSGIGRLLLGRDAGLRGQFTLGAAVLGTVGQNAIAANLQLADARRAGFVPPAPLSVYAACNAIARDTFHSFSSIECRWPPDTSSAPAVLALAADLPDIRRPHVLTADLTLPALPTATLLDWLALITTRPPTGILPLGTLAGTLSYHAQPSSSPPAPPQAGVPQNRIPQPPQPAWTANFTLTGASLKIPGLGSRPIPLDDITLRSTPAPAQPLRPAHGRAVARQPPIGPAPSGFDLLPIAIPLGAHQPATIDAHFDRTGYTLHLTGTAIPARLLTFAAAIPQFGDGLAPFLAPTPDATDPDAPAAPIHLDLTATRPWGGPQTWIANAPPPPHRRRR